MTRVLVIDNYDSFVYTLNGYLLELGAETTVLRNDAFEADAAADRLAEYDAVLLSARSRHACGRGGVHPGRARGAGRRRPAPGRLPRTPGDRGSVRRDRQPRRRDRPRQDFAGRTRRERVLPRRPAAVPGDPLPLAGGHRFHRARRSHRHLAHRGRGDHGATACRARPSSVCSSTRSL